MTLTTQVVLATLLDFPGHEMYGRQLSAATGLPTGSIHPMLARLERLGWVHSRWEQPDPEEAPLQRARRRYYRLVESKISEVRAALARAQGAANARRRPAG